MKRRTLRISLRMKLWRRRIVETSALQADEVLPGRPLRQWVLPLPHALRFLVVTDPAALSPAMGYGIQGQGHNFDATAAIKRTIREHVREKWKHATLAEQQLFWKNRDSSIGVRGEVKFEGVTVHTASPGILAYTATLPDALTIDVPLAFTQNNVGAVLDVAFDGQTMASFRGDDYLTDEINLLSIDISSFAGRIGELTFTLNTSGPDSAEIFVAARPGGLKFAALAPVPEPGNQRDDADRPRGHGRLRGSPAPEGDAALTLAYRGRAAGRDR